MSNALINGLFRAFRRTKPEDQSFISAIIAIIGQAPDNLSLYRLALRHSSASNSLGDDFGANNNERLEFLGDAILGAVVGEYLFRRFPLKDEGFLTEIRSRIVNRESMGILAGKLGIPKIIDFSSRNKSGQYSKSMHGDAMEALIGAVYLDKGYQFCKNFIIKRLIHENIDLDELLRTEGNPKSRMIEYAQRLNKSISFDLVSETGKDHQKEFIIQVVLDGKVVGKGKGSNKKRAEQDAAAAALNKLQPNDNQSKSS